MPWKLEKAEDGYYVVDDTGKRYSKKPLPKKDAETQMRALYATEAKDVSGGLHVFKQADGKYRWVLISSSASRDRDGEIISEAALVEDVDRCDAKKEYGPLRWWHMGSYEYPDGPEKWETWKAGPGVDLGTCDFNMVHSKMLIESGTFKSEELGEAFANSPLSLEVSIAYSHPLGEPGKEKEFNHIHRFERSLLPAGMASNLLTHFYTVKGEPDMKAQEKLAALVAILKGKPDVAAQILADAESVQKAASEAGLEFKEVSELLEGSESTPVNPPPTEPDPPVAPPPAVTDVTPATDTAPETIGDWTQDELSGFVSDIFHNAAQASQTVVATKEAGLEQQLADLLVSLKALSERVTASETLVKAQAEQLSEFTDTRPVGIKQLQQARPSNQESNITDSPVPGPQIDPGFMNMFLGGSGNG